MVGRVSGDAAAEWLMAHKRVKWFWQVFKRVLVWLPRGADRVTPASQSSRLALVAHPAVASATVCFAVATAQAS